MLSRRICVDVIPKAFCDGLRLTLKLPAMCPVQTRDLQEISFAGHDARILRDPQFMRWSPVT